MSLLARKAWTCTKRPSHKHMIHPNTFAPLSATTYEMAPEFSEPWCSLMLTMWWFGPPYSSGFSPDTAEREVRWKQPLWRDGDYEASQRGVRSLLHIAGGRLQDSGLGPDDKDFARDGLKADDSTAESDAWGW